MNNKNGNVDQLADRLKLPNLLFTLTMSFGRWAYIHSTNTLQLNCARVCARRDSHIDLFFPTPDTITLMLWMGGDKHSRHATWRGCWRIIKLWKRHCRTPSFSPTSSLIALIPLIDINMKQVLTHGEEKRKYAEHLEVSGCISCRDKDVWLIYKLEGLYYLPCVILGAADCSQDYCFKSFQEHIWQEKQLLQIQLFASPSI